MPVSGVLPDNAFQPASRDAWRQWLSQNHGRDTGIWLVSFKKDTGRSCMSYDEAVEEALCFGWIDSKPKTLDAERAMLWFSPRKAGTGWSAANKQRIERALAAGRMAAPGLAKVEKARADGSWFALDAVEALTVPHDLQLALAAYAGAAGFFEAFPRSVKRSILEWISQAKTPATRDKRVQETARLAADNERANQWRKPVK